MTSTMRAAIHLEPNYLSKSEIFKNTKFDEMEHSEEILNVTCLKYSSPSWARSVLANDQAIKWAKAKVCVYADSVLCVEQKKDSPGVIERWKGEMERLRLYSSYQDAVRIDGEAIEFEWKIFPGFSSLSILQEIQQDLGRRNIQPGELKDRIIFMPMFSDIEWKTNDENCISNAEKVKNYAMRFSQKNIGHSWVQGRERSGMEILVTLKKENGILQPTKWYSDSKKLVILCS